MPLQLRPKDSNGPMYAPHRDLAYIYAPAMTEALRALDEANWTPEMSALLASLGVTELMIGQATESLMKAHQVLVNVDGVMSSHDALQLAGWYEHPASVRNVIYARLGEVILGGFFVSLRDTSKYAEESSQSRQIADLVASGRLLLERSIRPTVPRESDTQLKQILSLQAELETCRTALAKSTAFNAALLAENAQIKAKANALAIHAHNTLGELDDYSFLERLLWAFRYRCQSGALLPSEEISRIYGKEKAQSPKAPVNQGHDGGAGRPAPGGDCPGA